MLTYRPTHPVSNQWEGFGHWSHIVSPVQWACLSVQHCVCCVFMLRAAAQTGSTIYHWHNIVQSQGPTTLLTKGVLTCAEHLQTPKLGVNWGTGHSQWDRNQLERLWIKASAHWNYKQCCVLNQQDPQIQQAMSVSLDLRSVRYNNMFRFTLSSTINMQGFLFVEGKCWRLDLLQGPDIIFKLRYLYLFVSYCTRFPLDPHVNRGRNTEALAHQENCSKGIDPLNNSYMTDVMIIAELLLLRERNRAWVRDEQTWPPTSYEFRVKWQQTK